MGRGWKKSLKNKTLRLCFIPLSNFASVVPLRKYLRNCKIDWGLCVFLSTLIA
jgi:hypothetical protein